MSDTTPSVEIEALPTGVYRHYKGKHYLVLGTAHDSNHEGRIAVIYVPLYEAPGPRLAVRDLHDFRSWVHEDGSPCDVATCDVTAAMARREVGQRRYDETHCPRFLHVGECPIPPGSPEGGDDR